MKNNKIKNQKKKLIKNQKNNLIINQKNDLIINQNNKTELIQNEHLLDDYEILANKLNNIFKNIDNEIVKSIKIDTNNKFKPRNRILTFEHVLSYYFQYSFKNNTKMDVACKCNDTNNLNVNISNYHRKEACIPLDIYILLFTKTKELFNSYNNSNDKKICPVDGVYNNTNIKKNGKLETSLNLGIYDNNNKIPVEIIFKGEENKNKEIDAFKKYVYDKEFDHSNIIYIFDRAYFSYTHNFSKLSVFQFLMHIYF